MSAAAILKLQASGFTADQVTALAELIDTQAATKADVDGVEHRLELKIADLKSELKGDIADLKAELKGDIAAVKSELRSDIAAVKSELKGDVAAVRTEVANVRTEIAAAKNDTLRWIFGFNIGLVVAVFTIAKYLH
jgi:phage shock protein A